MLTEVGCPILTVWVAPALTVVFIRSTLDLQASYCTVSFFPITLHQQCSVLLPDSIPFFLSASPPFRCQHLYTIPALQILQLDGWTSAAHSSSLLSPALAAVFTSSCSQLDKWCPSLSFSLFFSLCLLPTLCPYLCPFFSLLQPAPLGPVRHCPL